MSTSFTPEENSCIDDKALSTNKTDLCDTDDDIYIPEPSTAELPSLPGMARCHMEKLVRECGLLRVRAVIEYARKQRNIRNLPGFVINGARGRFRLDLAALEQEIKFLDNPRLRYITGPYADFIHH
jgi:hypothetical protein